MRCRKAQKQFSLYRDGRLLAEKRQPFEAHIKECAACAAEWRLYEQALGTLRRKETARVSPSVWVEFRARLEKEKEESGWWKEETRSLGFLGASAVSLVLVLLVCGWIAAHQQEQQLALQNFLTDSQYGKVLVVF